MVGEVWPDNFSANDIKTYSSSGMTLFNFMNSVTGGSSLVSYATSVNKAGVVFSDINYVQSKQEKGTKPVFFLSNHDQDRLRSYFSKYKDEEERLLKRKLAASYCLLTPGTPFLYYGEEKGTRPAAKRRLGPIIPGISLAQAPWSRSRILVASPPITRPSWPCAPNTPASKTVNIAAFLDSRGKTAIASRRSAWGRSNTKGILSSWSITKALRPLLCLSPRLKAGDTRS